MVEVREVYILELDELYSIHRSDRDSLEVMGFGDGNLWDPRHILRIHYPTKNEDEKKAIYFPIGIVPYTFSQEEKRERLLQETINRAKQIAQTEGYSLAETFSF